MSTVIAGWLMTNKQINMRAIHDETLSRNVCAPNCWPFRKVTVKKITRKITFSSHRFLLKFAATLNLSLPTYDSLQSIKQEHSTTYKTGVNFQYLYMCFI